MCIISKHFVLETQIVLKDKHYIPGSDSEKNSVLLTIS